MTESEIAAFVDGRLTGDKRVNALAHLDVCDECRFELAEVQALLETAPRRDTAQQRIGLVANGARQPAYVFAAVASLAAVVALVMLAPISNRRNELAAPRERVVAGRSSIQLISPRADEKLTTSTVRFVWNAEDDATYRITVTGADGATLWTETTSDTSAVMPAEKLPAQATTIHWFVAALRSDGQTMSSALASFRVVNVP